MIPTELPWLDGLVESQKLGRAFISAIASGEDNSGPSTRVPMVKEGLDIVVFLVFTAACMLINWGVRTLVVAPIARVILHGPQKAVRLGQSN